MRDIMSIINTQEILFLYSRSFSELNCAEENEKIPVNPAMQISEFEKNPGGWDRLASYLKGTNA